MYIIPMYLSVTTFTKILRQMSFHLYFLLFLFRSGVPPMTLLTAGALTDPRLPATASNVCTTDATLGGVGRVATPPPQTKILATPVSRRDANNVTRRVMDLAIPGARRRGRPKKTWHQQIKENMTGVGVTQDVALDRKEWRRSTRPPRR